MRGGELVVITGPSGSGKSTLLGLAAGLLDPVAGSVTVGGQDWADRDRSGRADLRRRALTLSPQRALLVEPMTVRENLITTARIRGLEISADEPTRVAAELGLTPLLDQLVDRLSGGERQRVTIARCLIAGVDLLLLDEPTSQQDEASATQVIDVLLAEAAAGRAVVAATHDPRLIERASRTLELGSS